MRRETATLFRTFAAIDFRSQTEILQFVSKYGLLGTAEQHQKFIVPRRHFALGESYLTWAHEICLMREALRLDQLRKNEAERRRDREAWARQGLKPPVEERRRQLARLVNYHLQHVPWRMTVEADVAPRLSPVPQNLLAAMWLQLALSVAGDKEFPECKFCHRLFEISTEQTGFRRHREFCSDSCKTKDYRRRKRTALKLAKEGASASTVAKRVETDMATVEGWLSRPKGKKLKRLTTDGIV